MTTSVTGARTGTVDPQTVVPTTVSPGTVDPNPARPSTADPVRIETSVLADSISVLGESISVVGDSTSALGDSTSVQDPGPVPQSESRRRFDQLALFAFIAIPFLAVLAAVPVAWNRGLGWHDIVIASVMYLVAGHGITVGFHRCFTHGAFKPTRGLRVALAVAGSLAIEGPVIRWVADHRRHHAFSDRQGDPHSPWRYGETIPALLKGLCWAHVGWLFDVEQTPRAKYVPDLLADKDLRRVDAAFPVLILVSLLTPAIVGGLWSMSWRGAVTAFFWGSLVRISLLHHVTWSINSICHAIGERPFNSRDRSANVWWLAVVSMGESWHNLHHADPTCARHGVDRGQLDSSARMIWVFEKLGWAADVRWPRSDRIEGKRRG